MLKKKSIYGQKLNAGIVIGIALFSIALLMAICPSLFTKYDPYTQDLTNTLQSPPNEPKSDLYRLSFPF